MTREYRKLIAALVLLPASFVLAMTAIVAANGNKHHTAKHHTAKHRTAVVTTDKGPVRGISDNGMDEFLGIPFAAPPVGPLRWQPPQPAARWHHTLDTVAFADKCVQGDFGLFSTAGGSEDCLYLNVYTPKGASEQDKGRSQHSKKHGKDDLKPVMVLIYGGGLRTGDTNSYDPVKLVTQGDVVFVSVSYRVNIFGFMAHPALDTEGDPTSNYGIMDQQAALKWVQRNIRQFGGDPKRVTIFGESAGASSVYYNIISPTAKGLFQRAITESTGWTDIGSDYSAATARGLEFAAAVGCGSDASAVTADCLRSVSTQEIIDSSFVTRSPVRVLDGKILTINAVEAIQTGQYNHVPVIIGTNRDEFTWFISFTERETHVPLSAADYVSTIESSFGANAPAVLALYPVSDYPNPSNALSTVQTDSTWPCQSRRLAVKPMTQQGVPVYAYTFTDRTAPYYFPEVSFNYWAAHTLELQFLFKEFKGAGGTLNKPLSRAQERLSDDMVSYWTEFARSGNPNSRQTPYWPRYTQKYDNYQKFDLPRARTTLTFAAQHKCDFWDGLASQ